MANSVPLTPVREPIPVTLVTGFLGSGKTTLLNHILGTETGRRFAIIENEYGSVGVDGSLVNAPKEFLFELNDGCVCCTVRSDLVEVFEQLTKRPDDFDHVIIETTGLADPAPVMKLFERTVTQMPFRLDGVVTVVDAAHIEENLDEVETCEEQITYADLLILNKIDGIPHERINAIEIQLRRLNPLAEIVRTQHAQVDVERVLQTGRLSNEQSEHGHHHHHGHHQHDHHHHDHHHHDHHHDHDHHHHDHHDHDDHRHDEAIITVAVEAEGEIDIDRLDQWLGSLTRRKDQRVIRMKGVLAVPGQQERFVFQGVRDVIDVRPDRPWGTAPRTSRIVFIGRGLDFTRLQSEFSACIPSRKTNVSESLNP